MLQLRKLLSSFPSATRLLSSWVTTSRNSLFTTPPTLQKQQHAYISSRSLVSQGIFQKVAQPPPPCSNLSSQLPSGSILSKLRSCITFTSVRTRYTDIPKRIRDNRKLMKIHREGPHKKFRPPRQPLGGAPMLKGVVLKTLIKKPKKPNSANRKCVLVRLSNGEEKVAYIPGIGHNLQEHNVVLVRCGRLQDVPGVKLKCVRGKYDLAHVIKQPQK